jgi:hypothetical protein
VTAAPCHQGAIQTRHALITPPTNPQSPSSTSSVRMPPPGRTNGCASAARWWRAAVGMTYRARVAEGVSPSSSARLTTSLAKARPGLGPYVKLVRRRSAGSACPAGVGTPALRRLVAVHPDPARSWPGQWRVHCGCPSQRFLRPTGGVSSKGHSLSCGGERAEPENDSQDQPGNEPSVDHRNGSSGSRGIRCIPQILKISPSPTNIPLRPRNTSRPKVTQTGARRSFRASAACAAGAFGFAS